MTKRMNDTEERRRQILDAARLVFLQKGFYAASIDDVAAAAHVVRGTVLHYFKNKSGLMTAVLEQTGGDIVTVLTELMEDTSLSVKERLHNLIVICSKQFHTVKPDLQQYGSARNATEFRAFMDQLRIHAFYQLCDPLEHLLQEGCEQGIFHINNPKARANAIIFAIFGLTGADISSDVIMQEMEQLLEALY